MSGESELLRQQLDQMSMDSAERDADWAERGATLAERDVALAAEKALRVSAEAEVHEGTGGRSG